MPKSRFSRKRVIDSILDEIRSAKPQSALARMVVSYGLEFSNDMPAPGADGQLLKIASNLGLVTFNSHSGDYDFAELAYRIFPKLGFHQPNGNREKAIEEAGKKVAKRRIETAPIYVEASGVDQDGNPVA